MIVVLKKRKYKLGNKQKFIVVLFAMKQTLA